MIKSSLRLILPKYILFIRISLKLGVNLSQYPSDTSSLIRQCFQSPVTELNSHYESYTVQTSPHNCNESQRLITTVETNESVPTISYYTPVGVENVWG